MTIFFINRFFYPDHSATAQLLSQLAFALAGRGYEIEVITSCLCYDNSQKLKRQETIRGVRIVRLPTSSFGRGELLGRTADYLTFYLAALFSLLRRVQRGDIVVAKTDPPLLSLLTVPLCWLKGAGSVNWLQDLFPEVAQAYGLGKGLAKRRLLSGLRFLRDRSLKSANMNVAIGKRMAAKLQAAGVETAQIRVISNWANGSLVCPTDRQENALAREWGLSGMFVVGYSGNLGRAHGIETMLATIRTLEQDGGLDLDRPVRWLFIGDGARMDVLKSEVTARHLSSVLFKPYQPRERLCASLSLPDVHLISLLPQFEGLIVPSKYYGIAAAGRPAIFIGNPEGEVANTIRHGGTGFVVPEGDGEGLATAILALARDPGLARAQGARARAQFEAQFDFPHALGAWLRLLGGLRPADLAIAGKTRRQPPAAERASTSGTDFTHT